MIGIACTILFIAALGALLYVRTFTLLAYFQQEEYDSRRFPHAVLDMRLFDVLGTATIVILLGAGILLGLGAFSLFVAALGLAFIAWRERRYKFKKPLVRTPRANRLAQAVLIALAPLALLALWTPWLSVLVIQAVPLVIMLANAALGPFERSTSEAYVQQAREKLAGFDGARIGITGSFGKTTVKHILGQVLAIDHTPFFSRGSINTVLGLTRHIRQRLQPIHSHFIAEMGAYQIGSINRLCAFVGPEYGIVTAVGDAHRERFGGIAEVAKAKSELAAWVCAHGKCLATTEAVLAHKPFADLYAQHREKFIVVGHSKDADVQIVDSNIVGTQRTIRLRLKKQGRELVLPSPLLAKHTEENIALVVALISRLSPETLDHLPAFLPHIEQVPHRLECKERVSGPMVLDDAYNSNELGFKEAVDVLRTLANERGGKAILITPGIVELGDAHDAVHQSLGAHCGTLCDKVYVVNPDRIPSFMAGLAAAGRKVDVTTVRRFSDALADVAKHYSDKQNVVLYENDLPDLLEEKRVL